MANEERILRDLLDKIATEQGFDKPDVTIQPISSGGANYTTKLYLATIKGDKELRLFAKVAAISEKIRDVAPIKLFDIENCFYTNITKIYGEIEEESNVSQEHRLIFPKFYGCNPNFLEETIVLENLVHQGFGDYNRLVSVDWKYAARAIEDIAKLHALSHAYKQKRPVEFEKTLEKFKFEWSLPLEQREMFWNKGKKTAIDAIRKENKDRVERFLNERALFLDDLIAPIDATVLVHGDYRVSNLLHKYNDDGTITIKIVDFQTFQGGCPMADLVYFIITSTDEEFRREHYERLVDHYYETLCAALRRLDVNPDEVYPRKVMDYELKEKLRFAMMIAVWVLPLVTIEAENAPVISGNSDLESFAVQKTSELYAERLNGIIDDCIRWGVL